MDTGEGMCYEECCEWCKTDESQIVPLKQILHYMFKKKMDSLRVKICLMLSPKINPVPPIRSFPS